MRRTIWNEGLILGIEDIDRQHRKILDFIDKLEELQEDQVRPLLLEIGSYLAFHFRFEEALMEDAGYKFVRAHKKVHELMSKRLTTLYRRSKDGEDIAAELYTLLNIWIYNHIQNDDIAYLPTVKAYLLTTGKVNTPVRWWMKIVHACLMAIGIRR